jgi:hypothetical protein
MAALQQRGQHCNNNGSTATMMTALPRRSKHCHIDDMTAILMKVQIFDDNTSTRWQHNHTMPIQEHPEQLSPVQ